MKINAITEGIRTGAGDLANIPLNKYTVGFEFEVSVRANFDTSGIDMGDMFSPEEEGEAQTQAFDVFIEEWHRDNFDDFFTDWIESEYNRNWQKLVDDYDIEPKYGFPEDSDAIRTYYLKELRDEYSEKEIEAAGDLVEYKYKQRPDVTREDIVQVVAFDYLVIQRNTVVDIEKVENKVDSLIQGDNWEKLFASFYHHASNIRNEFSALTDVPDVEEIVLDSDGEMVRVDEIIGLNEFLTLFDVEKSELEDLTQEQWQDVVGDRESEDFQNWWYRNRERYLVDEESGLQYALSRVKEEMPDLYSDGWSVVPDGTQGVEAEIVTTEYPVERGLEVMRRVMQLIQDDSDIETTPNTGLHVNIGTFSRDQIRSIDWLKFMVVTNPKRILETFKRGNNLYAEDRLPNLIASLEEGNIRNYEEAVQRINSEVMRWDDKMTAINFKKLMKHGYFEVRAPGNTDYEKKGDQLEEYIRIIVRALEIASDPQAFRNQYLKRLVKMFGKEKGTGTQPITVQKYFRDLGIAYDSRSPVASVVLDTITSSVEAPAANASLTTELYKQISNDVGQAVQQLNRAEAATWIEKIQQLSEGKKKWKIIRMIYKKLSEIT